MGCHEPALNVKISGETKGRVAWLSCWSTLLGRLYGGDNRCGRKKTPSSFAL